MGHISLYTASKYMLVKNVCATTPATPSNVIIGPITKIICEPCFAGGVTKIANNEIYCIFTVACSMALNIPNCAIRGCKMTTRLQIKGTNFATRILTKVYSRWLIETSHWIIRHKFGAR